MTIQFWRLSEAREGNLGLTCTADGLLLGRTPLIERQGERFVVRDQRDIERLFSRAYRDASAVERIMSGLGTVAAALNADDRCLACIAAVHMRIPDLPDFSARDRMEAEDALIKCARSEAPDPEWDPAKHPRTGTPPNPGWFAPTDGENNETPAVRTAQTQDPNRRPDVPPAPHDDWVRLPPGPKRIDELADFVEWIANARPEDEQTLRAEIKRYFCDVGDQASCNALNAHLTALLKPGITREDRQRILNLMDAFTRADPAEAVRVRDWTTAGALAVGGVAPAAAGERAAGEAAAAESTAAERATAEASAVEARAAPSEVWTYGWAKRGREIHDRLGDGSLHQNFPVIDMISQSGVVTSIKTIDLRAAVYQNEKMLIYRINRYVDKISEFDGAKFAGQTVRPDQITGRTLNVVVPAGSMTERLKIAIEAVRVRARNIGRNVEIIVTPY